jgi:hypothetical protein
MTMAEDQGRVVPGAAVTDLPVIGPSAALRPLIAGQLRIELENARTWLGFWDLDYDGAVSRAAGRLAGLGDEALLDAWRVFAEGTGPQQWLACEADREQAEADVTIRPQSCESSGESEPAARISSAAPFTVAETLCPPPGQGAGFTGGATVIIRPGPHNRS